MKYRIDEIRKDARIDARARSHERLLVYVSYLDDSGKLLGREGFAMDVPAQIARIVRNRDGWLKRKSDGVFVDPATLERGDKTEWQRETIAAEVPAIIRGNIERVLAAREARKEAPKRGAHFDKTWQPAASDDKGILQRSDVRQLKGVARDAKGMR